MNFIVNDGAAVRMRQREHQQRQCVVLDNLNKIASISWKRLLVSLITTLYVLQVLTIFFFRNAMYSPLNNRRLVKKQMHDELLLQSEEFLDSLALKNKTDSINSIFGQQSAENNKPLPLSRRALIIPTTKRRQRYLDVLLWSLLAWNEPKQLAETSFMLLNTQHPAQANVDLQRWQQTVPGLPIQISENNEITWHRRELADYLAALEWCQGQACPWCIVIEEDTLLTRNFLLQFQKTVEQVWTVDRVKHENIGMVKLFVSDHWDGFGTSWTHVQDVAIMAVVALLLVVCLMALLLLSSKKITPMAATSTGNKTPRHYAAFSKLFVAYAFSLIGIYIMCRLMGRQTILNLMEPSQPHLDFISNSTAGTVGVAFPRAVLPLVTRYLQNQLQARATQRAIDLALNDWLTLASLRALRTRPSLVQHIGAFSSARFKNQGNFQEMKQDSAFVF